MFNLANCKLRNDLRGHQGYVNTVTVSPDGSLCASGGKDGVAMLWDLSEGKRLYRCAAPGLRRLSRAVQQGSGLMGWHRHAVAASADTHSTPRHAMPRPARSLDAGSIIHGLVFSPNRYWLVAATQTGIKARHQGRRNAAASSSAAAAARQAPSPQRYPAPRCVHLQSCSYAPPLPP